MKTVVPRPEISYLWLGEATIGCPTLFFGLVSWGVGISPLRAGTEGSRLAYKRASQHTVATIGSKGLKTSIILLIVEFFLHWTQLEISGSRNLDDIVLFLKRLLFSWGLIYASTGCFLITWGAHYGCVRFSSAFTKISKSVLAPTTAGFWFHVRTNGRELLNLSNVNFLLVSSIIISYILIHKKKKKICVRTRRLFEFTYVQFHFQMRKVKPRNEKLLA